MKSKRFLSIFLTLCLAAGLAFSAGVSVHAAETPAGYVAICVDANVLGAGLLYGPALVPFNEGESAIDITDRFLGANAEIVSETWGDFLDGVKLPRNFTLNVPQVITAAVTDFSAAGGPVTAGAILRSADFAAFSGWMITINNEMTMVGASDEFPEDGDVLRWEFSLNFGNDLGYEDWFGTPGLITRTDKGGLVASIAQSQGDCRRAVAAARDSAMAVLGKLQATQTEIDAAAVALDAAMVPALEQWQAKLPEWLAGIISLPNWVQWIIMIAGFGWIWWFF